MKGVECDGSHILVVLYQNNGYSFVNYIDFAF